MFYRTGLWVMAGGDSKVCCTWKYSFTTYLKLLLSGQPGLHSKTLYQKHKTKLIVDAGDNLPS
jgi:hypothetical protein